MFGTLVPPPPKNLHTVSVCLQPRGSIFQYCFLGEVQFKKSLKKGTFYSKNGVLFKKNPKNRTFEKAEVVFKSGAVYDQIQYVIVR